MPREAAEKRYWKTSKRAKSALDRDLAALEGSRTHPPGWPEGSYPNNAPEAEKEAHPDWPFIEYTQHLNESLGAYKRVENGVARHKNRTPKPRNSNDPLIDLLMPWFPDLLSARLPQQRLNKIQARLRIEHRKACQRGDNERARITRLRGNDTLARAIRRAAEKKARTAQ